MSKATTRIEGQTFQSFRDPWFGIRTYSDIEVTNCKIYACQFGWRHNSDYSKRTTVQRIVVAGCEFHKSTVGPALLREVTVENIKSDLIIVYCALFEHVVFKGRCGQWMIHGAARPEPPYWLSQKYKDDCAEFYSRIDWAIDISSAEFEDFDLRTGVIPARCIKRDPETQVIVKRDRVQNSDWKKMELDSYTRVVLDMFLEDKALETVFVVGKRKQKAKRLIEDLRRLQAEGIAERD